MKSITIYSTPSCHFCHMAKEYLTAKGIPYIEHDVAADPEKRKEMMEISGQLGVPVIQIDTDVIVGFNKPLINQLLDIKE